MAEVIIPLVPYLPQEWKQHAACKGVDVSLFYMDRGDHSTLKMIRAMCETCPVQTECLNYSIDMGEKHGIWGGKTEKQRRKIRRERGGRKVTVRQETHGTDGGYQLHLRAGTPPCDGCREAHNAKKRAYNRELRARQVNT